MSILRATTPADKRARSAVTNGSASAVVAAIGEEFPPKARYSALAVGYNLGSAVFGDTAPRLAALLIDWFDAPVASSFLLVLASLIAIPLPLRMRDRPGMTMAQINAEYAAPTGPPL